MFYSIVDTNIRNFQLSKSQQKQGLTRHYDLFFNHF